MAQLGVVYRFGLREMRHPDSPNRILGSIDNEGTRLCDVMPSMLQRINHWTSVDGFENDQPELTFQHLVNLGTYFHHGAMLNHHLYGNRGALNRYAEGDRTTFSEVDNQEVHVGLVVSSPPHRAFGFIGFHVPNNRGVKTGVAAELKRMFREDYNLMLMLDPVVPLEAVEQSIDTHGVGEVRFRKLTHPAGLFDDDADWWSTGEDLATVELRLSPRRYARLLGRRVSRYIRSITGTLKDDETSIAFGELATFDDQTYDEILITVFIDGRKKVVHISPDGHRMSNAFSWELGVGSSADSRDVIQALAELLPE